MHRILFASLILSLPLTATQAQTPAAPATAQAPKFQTPVLKRPQLEALLAHPERVVVIDLRRPDEIQSIGSLPVYLSIQVADLPKSLGYIPKDRSIITVSNHAARAGTAGDLLTKAGYKVAGAVGVEFYEQEGGTLSKIAPPKAGPAAHQ